MSDRTVDLPQETLDHIQRGSPLLLFKTVARKSLLSYPSYEQFPTGGRELVAVPYCPVSFLPEYRDTEEPHSGCFVVSEQGHYHCFGCSAHGTVLRFLTDYLDLSFENAIEYCLQSPDLGKSLPQLLDASYIERELNPLLEVPL